jgi:Tol biopolymer transport system component
MDDGGRDSKEIVNTEDRRRFSATVSPDAEWIVYTRFGYTADRHQFVPRLFAMKISGGNEIPLTQWNPTYEPFYMNPVFSPFGDMIACEHSLHQEINPDIVLMNVERIADYVFVSNKATIMNPLRIGNYSPKFFPDNKRVIYLSNFSPEDLLEVCMADLSKPDQSKNVLESLWGKFETRRLTQNGDCVWWRPDILAVEAASETAFFVWGHYLHEYNQVCSISCKPETDPFNVQTLSENFVHISKLSISPDGRKIGFDGDGQLYIMGLDGGDLQQLTSDYSVKNVHPIFSPDGKRIAFIKSVKGKSDIYLIDMDGSDEHKITEARAESITEILWL